jgi:predicted secreted protein
MATITGNDGQVVVGSTTLAATRSWSIEMTADTIETSVMGTDVRTYIAGMSSFSGSADIYFDPAEFDGAESTFNPTAGSVGGAPIAVKLYVKQDASNDTVFTGNIIVTGYTVNSSMDGMVEASISFQGTGASSFSSTGNV